MRRTPRTGHWILAGAVAAAALGLTRTASAAQVTWNGAGGNAALGTTDVNDANQWLPTNVPTTGNDAYFLLDASTANRTTLALTNLM